MKLLLLLFCLLADTPGLVAAELEQVLEAQARALGGWERIRQIESAALELELEVGGMIGQSRIFYATPDKYRADLMLPLLSYTMACSDDSCWMADQQGLVHSLRADLKGTLITQQALEQWLYLSPDEFDGEVGLLDTTGLVDGRECFVIRIEPTGGTAATLCLDRETYLTVQATMVTDLGAVISSYSDFREVDGVVLPFRSAEVSEAGLVGAITTVSSVTFNVPLDDSLFARPATREARELTAAAADSVVVPFELLDNHIYLDLFIAGDGPFSFIFDTGAGGIGLNLRLLERLELERLGAAEARGVGGADSAAVYRISRISCRGIELDSVFAYAIDLSGLETFTRRPIDGVIGYDLLSRYIVSVDYDQQQLIIYHRDSEPRDAWGSSCPLMIDYRLPYVSLTVNDTIAGRFRIDTGSRSALDFNSPFVAEHQLVDSTRGSYHPVMAVGIGGGTSGLMGILPSLEIGAVRIESVYVSFSTSTSGLFSGSSTAGNLGAGILKRFRVTLDYSCETAYFKKSNAFSSLGRIRNMAGVRLTSRDGQVVVWQVLADGPASEKLREGDRLLSVDRRKIAEMLVAEVDWLLIGQAGETVEIVFERDGEIISDSIQLVNLY